MTASTPARADAARLAWFTPLPPVRSGIAAYSAELLPRLAGSYAIDVFVERPAAAGGGSGVFDAHDFLWRHAQRPYDLTVYQIGNETCHDYMWPYLVRHPGLVVPWLDDVSTPAPRGPSAGPRGGHRASRPPS